MNSLNDASPKTKDAGEADFGWSARRLRAILVAGFGGLLILMVVAGVGALYSLGELHRLEQQGGRQFLARSQALSTVILSVHVYNNRVEQYLLSSQPAQTGRAATEMANRAAEIHSALHGYPSDREPEEQRLLTELERQFAEEDNA